MLQADKSLNNSQKWQELGTPDPSPVLDVFGSKPEVGVNFKEEFMFIKPMVVIRIIIIIIIIITIIIIIIYMI